MIKITRKDFDKLVALLAKEGQDGATLTFETDRSDLKITTHDRANKQMVIEIADTEYNHMPRVTRTETF